MKFKEQDVLHIAELSRLKVTEQDIEKFTKQFNDILTYAEIINKLDTNNIEATAQATRLQNVLREDVVYESFSNEKALQNAPEQQDGCYVVPKLIDN